MKAIQVLQVHSYLLVQAAMNRQILKKTVLMIAFSEETSEISVDGIVEESRTTVTEPNTSIQEHNDLSDFQTTCTVLDLLESKDSPAVKEFLPFDDAEFDETSDITDSM